MLWQEKNRKIVILVNPFVCQAIARTPLECENCSRFGAIHLCRTRKHYCRIESASVWSVVWGARTSHRLLCIDATVQFDHQAIWSKKPIGWVYTAPLFANIRRRLPRVGELEQIEGLQPEILTKVPYVIQTSWTVDCIVPRALPGTCRVEWLHQCLIFCMYHTIAEYTTPIVAVPSHFVKVPFRPGSLVLST